MNRAEGALWRVLSVRLVRLLAAALAVTLILILPAGGCKGIQDGGFLPVPEDTTGPVTNLAIGKFVSDSFPLEGDTIVYTVVVYNLASEVADSVLGGDTLPAGLSYVSHTVTAGTYDPGLGTWDVGAMVAGREDTLTILAVVDSGTFGQSLTNEAGVVSRVMRDSAPFNNVDVTQVTVLRAGDPPPPPPVGADEPTYVAGTDSLLWADNFDRYTTVFSLAACDAPRVYGTRTMDPRPECDIQPGSQYAFTAGRGSATSKALRANFRADPGGAQQSVSWLSPWPQNSGRYTPTGTTIVVQYWFRASVGGGPGGAGTKWIEFWDSRTRGQFGLDASVAGGTATRPMWTWVRSETGAVNRTKQPVGPWWDELNDGQWHRATHLFRTNTWTTYKFVSGSSSADEVYTGGSSRDGRVAMWVDGTKILDFQNALVGVTPPGGLGPWCRQGDIDHLPAGVEIIFLSFPDVMNASPTAWTLDHDDLKWWIEKG